MSKRRPFSAECKAELVLGVLSGIKSQAEVCRE
jgi:transposase-like protein